MAYVAESREWIEITGHNTISVTWYLVADRTLWARFAPMVFIVKISKFFSCFIMMAQKVRLMRCWNRGSTCHWDPMNEGRLGATVARFDVMSWICCCVLVSENCPRLSNVKAMNQYACLENKLARIVLCLIELVVGIDLIPVKETWKDCCVSAEIRTCQWKPFLSASSQSS